MRRARTCDLRENTHRHIRGEPDHGKVRSMHLQEHRDVIRLLGVPARITDVAGINDINGMNGINGSKSILVVPTMRAVRRTNLHESCTRLREDIGDAKASANLDELATTDNDVTTMSK